MRRFFGGGCSLSRVLILRCEGVLRFAAVLILRCEGVLRLPRVLMLRCEGEARASKQRTRGSG
jgi:hypothetical protein